MAGANIYSVVLVKNSAAVDLASLAAVTSADTPIDVVSLDGLDAAPLRAGAPGDPGDVVINTIMPMAILARLVVQTAIVTDSNTITMRTTNASAAAVDQPSIAAGGIIFVVARK